MSTIQIYFPTGEATEYEESQLRALWEQGQIDGESQYWREGMPEWRPITELWPEVSPSPAAAPVEAPALEPSLPSGCAYTVDPRGLTSFLLLMLLIMAGAYALSALSGLGQIIMLKVVYIKALAKFLVFVRGLVGVLSLAAFVTTAVTFLMWIYRASLNSRGFGADGMKIKPGWAVGWYFVPVASLVMPYRAMKEILQVSLDPKSWPQQNAGPLLSWWWALWLITGILGNLAILIAINANTRSEALNSVGVSVLSTAVGVALCLVARKLVQTIAGNQETLVNQDSSR